MNLRRAIEERFRLYNHAGEGTTEPEGLLATSYFLLPASYNLSLRVLETCLRKSARDWL